jgi:hypothetical protein
MMSRPRSGTRPSAFQLDIGITATARAQSVTAAST